MDLLQGSTFREAPGMTGKSWFQHGMVKGWNKGLFYSPLE